MKKTKNKKRYTGKRSFLIWLIFLIVSVLLYIITDSDFPGFLIVLLLIYLAAGGLMTAVTGKKISVKFGGDGSGGKNQTGHLILTIKNDSVLPIFLCRAEILTENILTGTEQVTDLKFSVMPKGKKIISFHCGDVYCGCLRTEIQRIAVLDPLMLFEKKRSVIGGWEYYVQPSMGGMDLSKEELSQYDMESYRYSSDKKGDDPSETFDVRSYLPGDSIKSIHWKLSGKMDDIVIREPGLPVENSLMLLLDKRKIDVSDPDPEQIDKTTELFLNLSFAAVSQGIGHTAGWFNYAKDCFESRKISTTEDVFRMLPGLLKSPCQVDEITLADRFMAADLEKNYASYLYVTAGGTDAESEVERLSYYGKVTVYRPQNF